MLSQDNNDTIAAISTPIGEGGIGIVRISGDKSLDILSKMFVPSNPVLMSGIKSHDDLKIEMERKSRVLIHGKICDDKGNLIDEVLVTYMKPPTTYTGEATVEINCHGGIVPLRKILETALFLGARLADRGEFTKRAFLNGKLDLAQAEAVMDLISAKTDDSYHAAVNQLQGHLSDYIRDVRLDFVDILVQIAVNIDYPDEDIEEVIYSELLSELNKILDSLADLSETAERGRILREGLRIAIVGKPNVGKSSLMNALLYEDRAIVTDIPGTTRDTIEEALDIRGIPVVITDTAGIRQTEDVVEKIGVEKSKNSIMSSDLIFLILDGGRIIDDEDIEIYQYIKNKNHIILINKEDLPKKNTDKEAVREKFGEKSYSIAAKSKEGIKTVENLIEDFVNSKSSDMTFRERLTVTNVRHKVLIDNAISSVKDAIAATDMNQPLEIIEIDVNQAYEFLGEIIGETSTGDIIDKVFERFCLGK